MSINYSKKEELQLLQFVRKLLSDKNNWCAGEEAIDAEGKPAEPTSEKAVRWCAVGAFELARAELGVEKRAQFAAENMVVLHCSCVVPPNRNGIIGTNDGYDGYRKIMKAVNAAIVELGKKKRVPTSKY